ncbi:MAG: phosphate signaling complex protein PhoU [Bacteroidetes bacterium]|nr:phosphate signaling complex protein PhoU [Bacteroidota bacterium]
MERHFELELEKLKKRILKMGNLVASQVHQTMVALVNCDVELAREIIETDNAVDELDVKIDKLCQRIFALTQPVATDLRLIMASLRMNNDLERMGDHAVNIARRIDGLSDYKDILQELKINELAEATDAIVRDVIAILNSRNVVFIKDIYNDSEIIRERVQVISENIIEQMTKKSDVVVVATNLMIILSQIERIAGYSLNIAESIYFLVEGKLVKHKKRFWDQEFVNEKHRDFGSDEDKGSVNEQNPPSEV